MRIFLLFRNNFHKKRTAAVSMKQKRHFVYSRMRHFANHLFRHHILLIFNSNQSINISSDLFSIYCVYCATIYIPIVISPKNMKYSKIKTTRICVSKIYQMVGRVATPPPHKWCAYSYLSCNMQWKYPKFQPQHFLVREEFFFYWGNIHTFDDKNSTNSHVRTLYEHMNVVYVRPPQCYILT